ncbi:MAG: cadherin-like beta sandwich domain-containing protein [Bacilli bacterium]
MKKHLKILCYFIIGLTLLIPINTFAASGKYSISSNSSVEVGDTFSVTFTISGSKLFYWQAYINYDSSKLQLVSGSTNFQGESDNATDGQKEVTKTLKFKAKKSGSATISISMGDKGNNINVNAEEVTFSKVTKTITIKEKTVKTYSSNNYLKNLEIDGYEISPEFDKNTLEYNVELPANTSKIKINATKEDAEATINGDGEVEVSEGVNKIVIKVTAENGNTKEYIINATVKELDPIEVTVNGEKYNVIRKKEQLPKPNSLFEETTIKINDEEVPAFVNKITKYTLVGLKDKEGNINLYIYDIDENTYTIYKEFTFNKITISPIDEEFDVPEGYTKTTIKINDEDLIVYKNDKDSNYSIFRGINIETGEKNTYMYDSKENTIQRFLGNTSINTKSQETNIYLYTVLVLGSLLVITYLVILIILIRKKPKKIGLNYKK